MGWARAALPAWALLVTVVPAPSRAQSSPQDEVVFTFDDGPHEKYTEIVLDELARRDIKAVFYWVGSMIERRAETRDARVALVHRAVAEGHIVANHTVSHAHLCQLEPDRAAGEIDDNRALFEAIAGLPVILFRAPYGDRCELLSDLLTERALEHLHWNIDPHEYLHHDSNKTAAIVIRRLKKRRGRSVVLMHDTKQVTTRALPIILDWLETENRRRRRAGQQPIRVVDGSDLAMERLSPGLREWAIATGARAGAAMTSTVRRMVPGLVLRAVTRNP